MVRYPSPTLGSLPLPISFRSLSPILAATYSRPKTKSRGTILFLGAARARAFRQLVLVERHHTHVISRSRPSLK